jgi:hypothetical protein
VSRISHTPAAAHLLAACIELGLPALLHALAPQNPADEESDQSHEAEADSKNQREVASSPLVAHYTVLQHLLQLSIAAAYEVDRRNRSEEFALLGLLVTVVAVAVVIDALLRRLLTTAEQLKMAV